MSIIRGFPFLMSPQMYKCIVNECKAKKYGLVFIDHSIYGKLTKEIKSKTNAKVVTFFHGIIQYQNDIFEKNNKTSLLFKLPKKNMENNERMSVKYSDVCLLLNERDNLNLYNYYQKKTDYFLPEYTTDTASIEVKERTNVFEMLFVGGYFWPNIHGISWFVDNVMSKLNDRYHLTIVGNGMDKLKPTLERQNVTVMGRVESLDTYYNNADMVVGPIFLGEGMKTKTCEAFMYGKIYIGTNEAFEGYKGFDGYKCNTAAEFLKTIRKVQSSFHSKYYPEIRKMYEDFYSAEVAEKNLRKIFTEINLI